MKFNNQKGQAVLIVLLSLSVVLVVVMFVVSRTITDISLSTKEENSLRAFSAAEAGIERALVIGSDQGGEFGDAEFSAKVSNFAESSGKVTYPISLKSGESAVFWFTRYGEPVSFTGDQATFCWGDLGTQINPATPALEITVYYRTLAGEYRVGRKVVDPNTGGRTPSNGYDTGLGTCEIDGENFQFQNTVDFVSDLGIANYDTPGVLQYVSAKILYNTTISHKIGIDVSSSGSTLPSQGVKIESAGSYGQANRSIEVYQLHPVTPSVFEKVIFSATGITQ